MTRLALVLIAVLTLVGYAAPAKAACETVESVDYVAGVAVVTLLVKCPDSATTVEQSAVEPSTQVGAAACIGAEPILGQLPEGYCTQETVPALTPGLVSRALSRIPLPASELVVQPPEGRTLVNFATNFYTESEPFSRTITLLGRRVELRISPVSFGWRFGDGQSASTTTPGAAYPDLQVTHDYLSAGTVAPAVDTTYTADFRVDGRAWAPVPGTVTIPGAAVPLEVVEATPTLVGYR